MMRTILVVAVVSVLASWTATAADIRVRSEMRAVKPGPTGESQGAAGSAHGPTSVRTRGGLVIDGDTHEAIMGSLDIARSMVWYQATRQTHARDSLQSKCDATRGNFTDLMRTIRSVCAKNAERSDQLNRTSHRLAMRISQHKHDLLKIKRLRNATRGNHSAWKEVSEERRTTFARV